MLCFFEFGFEYSSVENDIRRNLFQSQSKKQKLKDLSIISQKYIENQKKSYGSAEKNVRKTKKYTTITTWEFGPFDRNKNRMHLDVFG
jgi:hypothetical protein